MIHVFCFVTEDERFIGVLPTFHTFGMFLYVFKSLLTGVSTMMLPRFEPEMFLNAIKKFRVSSMVCLLSQVIEKCGIEK